MSNLQRKLQMGMLPPPMPPPGRGSQASKDGLFKGRRDYSPVTWDHYFEVMTDVVVERDKFRLYKSGKDGPVCFCLHGGGFSALSWAVMSKMITEVVHCQCAAVDLRGHGDTVTVDETDLCADAMASDVERVINTLYGDNPPPILLIGHSMGGALAVHIASRKRLPTLAGLVVIDVVEGTALEALSSMQSYLRSRPKTFPSVEKAIEYCMRSGQIRNLESARVSVVGQLKRVETNETATAEIDHLVHSHSSAGQSQDKDAIEEEDETGTSLTAAADDCSTKPRSPAVPDTSSSAGKTSYCWRIDLAATEKFWKGWFEGLSRNFLSCSVPKLLLLAGVDRLDKDLTVGQMQGKFQMQVLPRTGHAVHEDSPEKVAEALATFLVRNRLAAPTESYTCILHSVCFSTFALVGQPHPSSYVVIANLFVSVILSKCLYEQHQPLSPHRLDHTVNVLSAHPSLCELIPRLTFVLPSFCQLAVLTGVLLSVGSTIQVFDSLHPFRSRYNRHATCGS